MAHRKLTETQKQAVQTHKRTKERSLQSNTDNNDVTRPFSIEFCIVAVTGARTKTTTPCPKNDTALTCYKYNFDKNRTILIIFGRK